MCRTGGRTSRYVRRGLSFGNILPNDLLNNMTGKKVFRKINNKHDAKLVADLSHLGHSYVSAH